MKFDGRYAMIAALASLMLAAAASAQSSQPAQTQPSPQDQEQGQYTGVSHPPPDSTIRTDEDQPAPAPLPKPSAAIPATAPTPAVTPTPAPAAQGGNSDYGIVTAPSNTSAKLEKRPWNPDDDIVNYVTSNPNELAEGTILRVRLSEGLSTSETHAGAHFRAMVDRDVYKDGKIIIPKGAEMRGRVVAVTQGHHLGPHATIRLRPEAIMLPDGTAYHLYAQVVQSKAAGTRADDEGGIQASDHYKKDAVEYGVGAGTGAVAGAEVAGPVGAGVGSLVGAGVVTAHLLIQRPQAADLPEGSVLVFSLTEPMALTPTKN